MASGVQLCIRVFRKIYIAGKLLDASPSRQSDRHGEGHIRALLRTTSATPVSKPSELKTPVNLSCSSHAPSPRTWHSRTLSTFRVYHSRLPLSRATMQSHFQMEKSGTETHHDLIAQGPGRHYRIVAEVACGLGCG